ncbi:type II secretion system GspH family protein [Synergistaceae bacterium OttesenSCG-928-D05]|nr:type II secretion system GspH family protein [Synergistaceae bacterium OttesenSCG-928-D05]
MRRTRKKGFTLVETFFVVAVMGALLSCIFLIGSGGERESELLKREADGLAIWLSNKITQAQMQNCGFSVQLSQWQPYNYEIRLRWLDGSNKVEVYKTQKVRLANQNASWNFTYSGEWHTVTPAVTFRILSKDGSNAPGIPVSLSGLGYVSVGTL